jgi:hypothetical protein
MPPTNQKESGMLPDAPPTPETGDGASPAPNLDPASSTPPVTEPPKKPEPDPEPEDVTGLKAALKAEREMRKSAEGKVKELTPYEEAAKKAEEANKTEVQKATDALNAERDARTKAETQLLRYTVGAAKNVPANLIKFLSGSTKEDIERAADELIAELGTVKPGMPGRPTERMVNGQPSKSKLDLADPMTLIRMGRGEEAAK